MAFICAFGVWKHIAANLPEIRYDELKHIRCRYIDPASLRAACAKVADTTLAVLNLVTWCDAGMACTSDSTKFGA